MKKLTIALATGLMSMSGWSACTYNFFANLLKSGKHTLTNDRPKLKVTAQQIEQVKLLSKRLLS